MYWLWFILIAMGTLFFFSVFIYGIIDHIKNKSTFFGTPSFILTLFFGLMMWAYIENKTYTYKDPYPITNTEYSVMDNGEVCIIMIKDTHEEIRFSNDREHYNYMHTINGDFTILKTYGYDVLGEYNGSEYTLKINGEEYTLTYSR